jgi:hypothetical protein
MKSRPGRMPFRVSPFRMNPAYQIEEAGQPLPRSLGSALGRMPGLPGWIVGGKMSAVVGALSLGG